MTSAAGLAFTTAVGMIHRVHSNTANLRTLAQPAATACFSDGNIFMLEIADLADRRTAFAEDQANFAGLQTNGCVGAFLGKQLSGRSGTAGYLSAFTGFQFDIMDDGTDWDILKLKAVTWLNFSTFAALNRGASVRPTGERM